MGGELDFSIGCYGSVGFLFAVMADLDGSRTGPVWGCHSAGLPGTDTSGARCPRSCHGRGISRRIARVAAPPSWAMDGSPVVPKLCWRPVSGLVI